MASLVQVIGQIRFALAALSSRNGHHEFEELCRRYVRARICSNILPATGPVSAGGDQGRDFETFRTYLCDNLFDRSPFIGLATDKVVVFACSMQHENLSDKIKKDIKAIATGGNVDDIHFLCSSDVPVSKRHALEKWAQTKHDVDLFIHDGTALSEGLADVDTFWIACEYLRIPAEIYPEQKRSDWYEELLRKWSDPDLIPTNFADFNELKDGVRHATFIPVAKTDLPIWLSKLEILIADSTPATTRRAIYEVTVAEFRGRGSMNGQENRLRSYFEPIESLYWPSDFEDATILCNYAFQAILQGECRLTESEIGSVRLTIFSRLKSLIEEVENTTTRCGLIEVKGYVEFLAATLGVDGFSFDGAFETWIRMLDHVDESPLFPLDRFADRVTALTPFVGTHPRFDELTSLVDTKLARKSGAFVAAGKARDRALNFRKNEQILKAIMELQNAKIAWFADETISATVISLAHLAAWYRQLGLTMAGKYMALSGCAIALLHRDDDMRHLAAPLAADAAICDFVGGAWTSFFETVESAFHVHFTYSSDASEFDKHKHLQELVFQSAVALATIERMAPSQFDDFTYRAHSLGVDGPLDLAFAACREAYADASEASFWRSSQDQLWGFPLSDGGTTRTVRWQAMGIEWRVQWSNDYSTNALGEQFVATLQILLADFASVDLCLLPATVEIDFSATSAETPSFTRVPTNTNSQWRVQWPAAATSRHNDDVEQSARETLAGAIAIVAAQSLCPHARLLELIESRFRSGLPLKAFCARPYAELLYNFIPESVFADSRRDQHLPVTPPDGIAHSEHPELSWRSDQGPTYEREKSLEAIRNRYRGFPVSIRHTLSELSRSRPFMKTVKKLRQEGWKDWHILAALFHVACSIRVPMTYGSQNDMQRQMAKLNKYAKTPESIEADRVPANVFSEEVIRRHHNMFMITTLRGWDLQSHVATPDFHGIEKFLRCRYAYWEDDVDHTDLFAADADPCDLLNIKAHAKKKGKDGR